MATQRLAHRPFEFPPDFGDRLTRFNEVSGLSCRGIASMLGVSPSRLGQWRNKCVLPSIDHLPLIAERIGLRQILMCHERDLPEGCDLEGMRQGGG